jgi:hypothetical protein
LRFFGADFTVLAVPFFEPGAGLFLLGAGFGFIGVPVELSIGAGDCVASFLISARALGVPIAVVDCAEATPDPSFAEGSICEVSRGFSVNSALISTCSL